MRLIDADAMQRQAFEDNFDGRISDGMLFAVNWSLERAPTVDAVPIRHGKWVRENNYGTWKCSECGCKVNRVNPLKGNIWNYNYCPNCGAKMDGNLLKDDANE